MLCVLYLSLFTLLTHYLSRCIVFLYHALGGDPAEAPRLPWSSTFENSTSRGAVRGINGRYKLIVASNRDEFTDRATAPIHFWTDAGSDILAGIMCGTAR